MILFFFVKILSFFILLAEILQKLKKENTHPAYENIVKLIACSHPKNLNDIDEYIFIQDYANNGNLNQLFDIDEEKKADRDNFKMYLSENFMNKLPYNDYCSIILDIINGLNFIHKNNIIHFDIFLRNIVLHNNSEKKTIAKIIDFGLAIDTSGFEDSEKNHQPQRILPNEQRYYPYQSFECVDNHKEHICLDKKLDHYCLAYTLINILFKNQMTHTDGDDIVIRNYKKKIWEAAEKDSIGYKEKEKIFYFLLFSNFIEMREYIDEAETSEDFNLENFTKACGKYNGKGKGPSRQISINLAEIVFNLESSKLLNYDNFVNAILDDQNFVESFKEIFGIFDKDGNPTVDVEGKKKTIITINPTHPDFENRKNMIKTILLLCLNLLDFKKKEIPEPLIRELQTIDNLLNKDKKSKIIRQQSVRKRTVKQTKKIAEIQIKRDKFEELDDLNYIVRFTMGDRNNHQYVVQYKKKRVLFTKNPLTKLSMNDETEVYVVHQKYSVNKDTTINNLDKMPFYLAKNFDLDKTEIESQINTLNNKFILKPDKFDDKYILYYMDKEKKISVKTVEVIRNETQNLYKTGEIVYDTIKECIKEFIITAAHSGEEALYRPIYELVSPPNNLLVGLPLAHLEFANKLAGIKPNFIKIVEDINNTQYKKGEFIQSGSFGTVYQIEGEINEDLVFKQMEYINFNNFISKYAPDDKEYIEKNITENTKWNFLNPDLLNLNEYIKIYKERVERVKREYIGENAEYDIYIDKFIFSMFNNIKDKIKDIQVEITNLIYLTAIPNYTDSCPKIEKVIYDKTTKDYYIIMEKLEEELFDHIDSLRRKKEQFNLIDIYNGYIKPILDIFQLFHENNIVHRDIKEENIMIVNSNKKEKNFKIIDFGYLIFKGKISNDEIYKYVGTPGFLNSEILTHDNITQQTFTEINEKVFNTYLKTDIFSLAILIYNIIFSLKKQNIIYRKEDETTHKIPDDSINFKQVENNLDTLLKSENLIQPNKDKLERLFKFLKFYLNPENVEKRIFHHITLNNIIEYIEKGNGVNPIIEDIKVLTGGFKKKTKRKNIKRKNKKFTKRKTSK